MALGNDGPHADGLRTRSHEVRDYMIDNRDQFRTFADSDSDTINLFKSGEIVLTDGGHRHDDETSEGRRRRRVGRARGRRTVVDLRLRHQLESQRTWRRPTHSSTTTCRRRCRH